MTFIRIRISKFHFFFFLPYLSPPGAGHGCAGVRHDRGVVVQRRGDVHAAADHDGAVRGRPQGHLRSLPRSRPRALLPWCVQIIFFCMSICLCLSWFFNSFIYLSLWAMSVILKIKNRNWGGHYKITATDNLELVFQKNQNSHFCNMSGCFMLR